MFDQARLLVSIGRFGKILCFTRQALWPMYSITQAPCGHVSYRHMSSVICTPGFDMKYQKQNIILNKMGGAPATPRLWLNRIACTRFAHSSKKAKARIVAKATNSVVPENTFEVLEKEECELRRFIRMMNKDFEESIASELTKIDDEYRAVQHEIEDSDELYAYYPDNESSYVDFAEWNKLEKEDREIFGLRNKRGERGVFEIDDIVDFVRQENGIDICVVKIPAELKYTDYLLIATCHSTRHMVSLIENIDKAYKLRRQATDPFTRFEGDKGKSWMVLDLGNVIIHTMLEKDREYYDIEQLWSVGEKYDDKCLAKPEPLLELVDKYSHILSKEFRERLKIADDAKERQ